MIKLNTNMGTISIELDTDKAPNTTANFLQYAKDGFYDGTIFHRVISNFMVQGGGMLAGMVEKQPREPIQNEADNGLSNVIGSIAMARTNDPHSASLITAVRTHRAGATAYLLKSSMVWMWLKKLKPCPPVMPVIIRTCQLKTW